MTLLDEARFLDTILDARHTARRLELQRGYAEPNEEPLFADWLAGHPRPGPDDPGLRDWYRRVAGLAGRGARIERVRVQDDPPTDYQRFERYLDPWNLAAGERLRYMTRQRAHEVGLLPAAGGEDWWLIDSAQLIVMRFDDAARRVENELVTDPATVLRACQWWDLAVHYSQPVRLADLAA